MRPFQRQAFGDELDAVLVDTLSFRTDNGRVMNETVKRATVSLREAVEGGASGLVTVMLSEREYTFALMNMPGAE